MQHSEPHVAADAIVEMARRQRFIRSKDVEASGIPRIYLTRLVRAGQLRRVAHGLYELTDAPYDERATIAEVCAIMPKSTLCVLTAAQFHQITSISPHAVWVTLPPGTPLPASVPHSIEVVYMNEDRLYGVTETHDYFGSEIRVTNLEKTVVDMFRYRSRVGLEGAIESLKAYVDRSQSYGELVRIAELNGIKGVIAPYLQAIAT